MLKKIQFLHDSAKENTSEFTAEVNRYLRQHKLNVEGEYDADSNQPHMPKKVRADCEEVRNDTVSHFVCRLAYCRNDELRKWLVTQETRLFYYRLEFYDQADVLAFLQSKCSLTFEILDRQHADWRAMLGKIGFNLESFLRRNRDKRLQGGRRIILDWYANEYIKIPFKHALSLIGKRNVFVNKGFAYVHLSELTTIARSAFRTKLNAELLRCFRHLS